MFIQFKIIFGDNDCIILTFVELFTFPLVRQVRPVSRRRLGLDTLDKAEIIRIKFRIVREQIGHAGHKYFKVLITFNNGHHTFEDYEFLKAVPSLTSSTEVAVAKANGWVATERVWTTVPWFYLHFHEAIVNSEGTVITNLSKSCTCHRVFNVNFL